MGWLWRVLGVGIASLLLVLFLFLPAVPYSVSFADPNNVDRQTYSACLKANNYTDPSGCKASAALPPSFVHGAGSPSYYLFGAPVGPFPELVLATQGNESYLLHFDGTRISFIEGPFSYTTAPQLNPSGVVRIDNVSISQWAFGFLNFSARVTNVGKTALWGVNASFQYPGYGTNSSYGPNRAYRGVQTSCPSTIPAGGSCVASILLNQSSRLLANQYYTLTVEVEGGYTSSSSGGFLSLRSFSVAYPGVGLNTDWVKAFFQTVNQQRNGTALTENRTLDEFAAFRYNTIRAQYQISDYNFTQDYDKFFGAHGPQILEEILYPNNRNPTTYPGYLKTNAPGHYGGLVDPAYTHYGYFFGSGPSVDIGPGCPATEIPGPNINITQYVISHGCTYVIADEIWFIVILGA